MLLNTLLKWPWFQIFVTPLYDTLPLDAVVGRCLVVDVQTYCKGRPRYPTFAEEDIYICEYRLDKGQRLFDKTHARNRYPICTKPYIFEKFAERLKVKRDFTVSLPSGCQFHRSHRFLLYSLSQRQRNPTLLNTQKALRQFRKKTINRESQNRM